MVATIGRVYSEEDKQFSAATGVWDFMDTIFCRGSRWWQLEKYCVDGRMQIMKKRRQRIQGPPLVGNSSVSLHAPTETKKDPSLGP